MHAALPVDLLTVTAPHERGEPLSVKLTVPPGCGEPVSCAVSVALLPTVMWALGRGEGEGGR